VNLPAAEICYQTAHCRHALSASPDAPGNQEELVKSRL